MFALLLWMVLILCFQNMNSLRCFVRFRRLPKVIEKSVAFGYKVVKLGIKTDASIQQKLVRSDFKNDLLPEDINEHLSYSKFVKYTVM